MTQTTTVQLDGEFNIYTASGWKDRLLAHLGNASATDVDLSSVNEFDSAGLQVLLLIRREALAAGKQIRLIAPSRCVAEVIDLCGLRDTFDIAHTADAAP